MILLGISGATTVIAKVKSVGDAAATPPPLDPAAARVAPAEHDATEAGATAVADAQTAEATIRQPRWSDLIMAEGQELAPTRVQMLLFTLVTAVFVVVKVITSNQIPDIPEGFLILMGISNGVYVGAKLVPDKPAG
jgi:hypothetical protein